MTSRNRCTQTLLDSTFRIGEESELWSGSVNSRINEYLVDIESGTGISSLKSYRQNCIESVAAEMKVYHEEYLTTLTEHWEINSGDIEEVIYGLLVYAFYQIDWEDCAKTHVDKAAAQWLSTNLSLPEPWLDQPKYAAPVAEDAASQLAIWNMTIGGIQ